jgi:hypothetical protein
MHGSASGWGSPSPLLGRQEASILRTYLWQRASTFPQPFSRPSTAGRAPCASVLGRQLQEEESKRIPKPREGRRRIIVRRKTAIVRRLLLLRVAELFNRHPSSSGLKRRRFWGRLPLFREPPRLFWERGLPKWTLKFPGVAPPRRRRSGRGPLGCPSSLYPGLIPSSARLRPGWHSCPPG